MNREQCRDCFWWRRLCSGGGEQHGEYRACHHLLLTKKRREVDPNNKDICLSKVTEPQKEYRFFEAPETDAGSTWSGYGLRRR